MAKSKTAKPKTTKGRRKSAEMKRLQVLAEKLFVEDGYSLTQIGEELDVSPNTLTKWKEEGNWEDSRDFLQNAPHRIEKLLLKELEHLAGGGDPTLNSDAISKVKSALAVIHREISPTLVFTVLKKLDNYTAQHSPELARPNLKLHRSFLTHIIEQYG